MSLELYIVAACAIVLTGISKSGFAGGLGVLAVPMISIFTTPQLAAAIMMPILVAIDCANIWRYRRNWSRPVVRALLPGALAGLALGAASFQWIDPALLKLVIGLLALLIVAQVFLASVTPADRWRNPAVVFAVGGLSGFASFIAHAGGPPVKGYLLSQNMGKSTFVGTNSVFFFVVNLIKAFAYSGMAQFSGESLWASLILSPFLIVGVAAGFWLHDRVDQRLFIRIAFGFLALAGVKLIWDGSVATFGVV